MKILDKYIIKSFLVPFFATFLVVLFVLVMQVLFQQFEKIAGKGLNFLVILKFFSNTALTVIPMALSIGILLSSIMALGNLAENYEFAAIKAAGVSFFQLVRPLIILMIILSGFNFLFLNYVFPYATYESMNLVSNMKKKQPAMALIAGSFNSDIPGFSIKFSEKYGEDKNLLKDVLIYDLRQNKYNNKIITAKYGEITSTPGSIYMTLILKNGYYVEDLNLNKLQPLNKDKMPFVKSYFDEHQINFDISSLDDLSDKKYDNHYRMLSLSQLEKTVSKQESGITKTKLQNTKRYFNRVKGKLLIKDTLDITKLNENLLINFDQKNKLKILKATKREISRVKTEYNNIVRIRNSKTRKVNVYKIEYHSRIAFSFACIVLFLVGAPLGSLIKKGGFGIPMLLAIFVFVVYYFIGVVAKGIGESSKISPFLAGWLSTFVMLPFGIFLMFNAINDKSGFGFINKFFNKIKMSFTKNKET